MPERDGIVPKIVDLELPRIDPGDVAKLLRLPEPRRTAMWIKMSFVACNDHLVDLHVLWEAYKDFFGPFLGLDPNCEMAVAEERRMGEDRGGQYEAERMEQHSPVKQVEEAEQGGQQQREENDASEETGDQHAGQDVPPPPPPTPPPPPPEPMPQRSVSRLLQSFPFYKVFTSRVHGMSAYSTNGVDNNADWRMVFRGVRARHVALTFPSTNRERGLRQLRKYKKHNAIIEPANMSRFSQLLARDPLFILPKEQKSPMYQRMVADHGQYGGIIDYDGKGAEDPAFPGLSLKRRDIYIGGRRGRCGRRNAPANTNNQANNPDDSQTASAPTNATATYVNKANTNADSRPEPADPNPQETHTEGKITVRAALNRIGLKPSSRIEKAVADSHGKLLAALDQLAFDISAKSCEKVDAKDLANVLMAKCGELHPSNKDSYSTRTKQVVQSILDAYPEAFDVERIKQSTENDGPKAGSKRRSVSGKFSKANDKGLVESTVAPKTASAPPTFMELATAGTEKADLKK